MSGKPPLVVNAAGLVAEATPDDAIAQLSRRVTLAGDTRVTSTGDVRVVNDPTPGGNAALLQGMTPDDLVAYVRRQLGI